MYEIGLTHTIDAAHRVVGHEGGRGKCARLHGHTYGFDVTLKGRVLDETGFVVDFAAIKRELDAWDHRTVLWQDDPLSIFHRESAQPRGLDEAPYGVVRVPFNPTAENISRHFAELFVELPTVIEATVVVAETAKSRARWTAIDQRELRRRERGCRICRGQDPGCRP